MVKRYKIYFDMFSYSVFKQAWLQKTSKQRTHTPKSLSGMQAQFVLMIKWSHSLSAPLPAVFILRQKSRSVIVTTLALLVISLQSINHCISLVTRSLKCFCLSCRKIQTTRSTYESQDDFSSCFSIHDWNLLSLTMLQTKKWFSSGILQKYKI